MSSNYKSYLDLCELESYNRFKDSFVYALGYSYAVALFLQLKLTFNFLALVKIVAGVYTLKLTFGIFTLFAINILLLNSYGHAQYNEIELQLWPILELIKQKTTLFVLFIGYYSASWIGMKILLSLAVKNDVNMWIYPEGTVGYEVNNPIYSINTIVTILLHSTLTCFILELSFHIYKQLMIEPVEVSSRSLTPEKALVEGLKLDTDPIFQHWAFIELYNISINNSERRKKIYFDVNSSESITWSEISQICLNILTTSIDINRKYLEDLNLKEQKSSTLLGDQILFSNIKSDKPTSSKNTDMLVDKNLLGFDSKLYKFLNSNIQNASLRRLFFNSGVNYNQFINIKLQVYSIRILSNFVVASANEDEYGQILVTVPLIIKILLEYLDVLVQLSNIGSNATSNSNNILAKSNKSGNFIIQTSVKEIYILIQVLRSSIYAIIGRFYEHLAELNLETQTKKQLQFFVDWKG
ncbi:hypothetical protein BB561_000929 [Smittium simulii]|uniref:Nucleoporin NDC1 n=1 Tax=Smittium simulii TaxID=133385 RepID=A0A2T9YWY5_9FUNG|nr:hypothetical protein BB561_000929 [Smittium simulii]